MCVPYPAVCSGRLPVLLTFHSTAFYVSLFAVRLLRDTVMSTEPILSANFFESVQLLNEFGEAGFSLLKHSFVCSHHAHLHDQNLTKPGNNRNEPHETESHHSHITVENQTRRMVRIRSKFTHTHTHTHTLLHTAAWIHRPLTLTKFVTSPLNASSAGRPRVTHDVFLFSVVTPPIFYCCSQVFCAKQETLRTTAH